MAMHEPGKSDRSVVPAKPANASTNLSFWELFEQVQRVKGRDLAKENEPDAQSVPLPAGPVKQVDRTQSRVRQAAAPGGTGPPEDLPNALDRVRQLACRDKQLKFTSLWHHVYDVQRLQEAYRALKRDASAGVDGQTWQAYGRELESNLKDLSERLVQGRYRAKPVRRVYMPKADGGRRPLGVPALEDKIVQRATVRVLNAVYETDFLGFSYGFRPGRSAHMALDALAVAIQTRKVNYVLDADIRGFFDTLEHGWLMKFIGHRIADQRVLRHVQKWLNAGVLEDGKRVEQEEGTPQGGSISPLLANIYLHYVLDLWAEQWSKRRAAGELIIVRYADDFVVGFQHESDARQFLEELRERFGRFNLELHATKTRILEFGRFAATNRERRGEGKPMTFNFLGFTHACDATREGRFIVLRRTMAVRMRAKLRVIKQELRKRLHEPVHKVGQWLRAVLSGHYRYFGVPRNSGALRRFRVAVFWMWRRSLCRRSQRGHLSLRRYYPLAAQWLPHPRVCQPYPDQRLRVLIQGKSPVR